MPIRIINQKYNNNTKAYKFNKIFKVLLQWKINKWLIKAEIFQKGRWSFIVAKMLVTSNDKKKTKSENMLVVSR